MKNNQSVIKVTVADATATFCVGGRFSILASRNFEAARKDMWAHSRIDKIIVNLEAVEYIDSSALGMLLLLREDAHTRNLPVHLSSAGGVAQQVVGLARFDKLFNMI